MLGGSESYAGACVAAAVGVAAFPFLAPLLEVYFFSKGSADSIEKTVRINQSLQVCNAHAQIVVEICLLSASPIRKQLQGHLLIKALLAMCTAIWIRCIGQFINL